MKHTPSGASTPNSYLNTVRLILLVKEGPNMMTYPDGELLRWSDIAELAKAWRAEEA